MKYLAFYSRDINMFHKERKSAHRIWAKVNGALCCDETLPSAAQPPFKQGETLYVAEPWKLIQTTNGPKIQFMDGATVSCPKPHARVSLNPCLQLQSPKDMPIWAARYFVSVTRIRKERIESISDANAIKEGYPSAKAYIEALRNKMRVDRLETYVDKNPWTWVIGFVKADTDKAKAIIRAEREHQTIEKPHPPTVSNERLELAIASLSEDRARGKYGGKSTKKKGGAKR